jgi:hypothetical protein
METSPLYANATSMPEREHWSNFREWDFQPLASQHSEGRATTPVAVVRGGNYPNPASLARMIACARSATCSLVKMLET